MSRRVLSTRWLILLLPLIPGAWLAAFFATSAWGFSFPPPDDYVEGVPICGRPLTVEQTGGRTFPVESTRVLLALDEQWRDRFGERADDVARSLLMDVGGLFRGLHIHLLAVHIASWVSPDGVDSATELLAVARSTIPPEGADIVVALTGRQLRPVDGSARVGGRYAVVGHHPDQPERDAFVLAHEVAHLFGATHGCDLEGHEGVMARRGFDEPGLICPCTREVLEMNAIRFHGP